MFFFSGNAMHFHHNIGFSTKDKGNATGLSFCAESYQAGWWYFDDNCFEANLNGLYHEPDGKQNSLGIIWAQFKKEIEPLKWTEIKIRPKNFAVAECDPFTMI